MPFRTPKCTKQTLLENYTLKKIINLHVIITVTTSYLDANHVARACDLLLAGTKSTLTKQSSTNLKQSSATNDGSEHYLCSLC